MENFNFWKSNITNENDFQALDKMNDEQIKNSFYKYLEFGTGGLRGVIGMGTNCMNVYTVGKASQGIANYMKTNNEKRICISYDSRNFSFEFAQKSAEVFASNGIEVYIVKELMPTPFLSYAVRSLNADMGIMITASHNPAEYNGYKVYGGDGCQITDKKAKILSDYIKNVNEFKVKTKDYGFYSKKCLIKVISDEIEENFIKVILSRSLKKSVDVKVTYTPLNGTGYRIIPKMLHQYGIQNIDIVKEQGYPNGDFTTCKYPNPEKKEALQLGLKYAKENDSDLLMATDPDSDRIGIAVKHNGEFKLLTGNEVGALLIEYILSNREKMPENPVVIKTIVTSDLGKKIAEKYGVKTINVLTGFKYIGEKITNMEKENKSDNFILGYEESYGYLIGDHVRDKDAVVAALMICEMTAFYLKQGKTLVNKINELYKMYGYFEHKLVSYEFKGQAGHEKIIKFMQNLRNNMPTSVGGVSVTKIIDFENQTELDLPKSNVIEIDFKDESKIIVRPSGTEPLLKIYLSASQDIESNKNIFANFKNYIDKLVQSI